MESRTNLVSAYHEAGHFVALLAAGHKRSALPLPFVEIPFVSGKPWYAPATFFDRHLSSDPRDRFEAMRNAVQHHAIVAMAGPVAEAQQTGRKLTEVLTSSAGVEDDRYVHAIGHKLYGRDFAQFRVEALAIADEILTFTPWKGLVSRLGERFMRGGPPPKRSYWQRD